MSDSMPLIAGTYKIISQIGSGGGGIVYLAEHLRLGKKVVLKADKRTLSAKPEVLRREVDALKDLSHTYIPQVYDFIEENGTVYTVMDYIDGDSFDKPLKRGERFNQVQVIEWACQLLEALAYLHGRPPHGILHADIKPSNVMLTPQGDVRLIDFNIALALGEEGAIAVGRSFGYASPEHYGLDYSLGNAALGINADVTTDICDTSLDAKTVLDSIPQPSSSGSTSGKKTVLLNVRSDIYSLGATLYHIMTGERPAQNAREVKPISAKDFSPPVIAIISKAMDPDQGLRWQSAEEMLYAFEHLHQVDPRTKRHKKITAVTASMLTVLFLIGGLTIFTGQRLMEQEQRQIAEEARLLEEEQRQIAEQERLEAEAQRNEAERQRIEADKQRAEAELQEAYALAAMSAESLQNGDRIKAVEYALDAYPSPDDLNRVYVPEARKALTDALEVYDLSDGFKPHKVLTLPSETLKTAISPDGKTGAAVTLGTLFVFDTETAGVVAKLPTVDSALADVEFVDNEKIVYAGGEGITLYDLSAKQTVWTGSPATEIAVSSDKSTFAAVYKDESSATVYDSDGNVTATVGFEGKTQRVAVNDSFANPNDNLLVLSADGNWLAVSFSDGALSIFDIDDPNATVGIYDESEFFHFEGGFSGDFFAFSSTGLESSVFAAIDMVNLEQTGGFESDNPFGVIAGESGIYISNEDVVVKIDPISGEQAEVAYIPDDVVSFAVGGGNALVGINDAGFAFFDGGANQTGRFETGFPADFVGINGEYAVVGSRNTPVVRILKQKVNAAFFEYDRDYVHDEARLNDEAGTVMLFSFNGFRLYDINGNLLRETELPNAGQIYDQQYRRDGSGSYLEVIYNDGKADMYSGVTGELIGSEQLEQPDLRMYEEFFTDTLRITSPLHGAPAAYDRESGEKIKELEDDAYLTYVTQAGENIITEYITAAGDRYGLLLDGKSCETLAYLPNLCDILGERLIFDAGTGILCETRIYTVSELVKQAAAHVGREG